MKGGVCINRQYNTVFNFTSDNGKQQVYVVGQLNRDIPFLMTTSKNLLVTPFLIENEFGKITAANNSKAYVVGEGLSELSIPEKPKIITTSQIKLPAIAVNDEDSHGVTYYPFVAFGQEAIYIHKHIRQGDTVVAIGTLVATKIPGSAGITKEVLWLKDVRLIRQSNRTKAISAVDVESMGG